MGNSKPITVGIVGMESSGLLTLVLVFHEATSKVLGLGLAEVLVHLGGLGAGIPAGLGGLQSLVLVLVLALVLVLVCAQLDVSNLFLFVLRIKVRLSDSLPNGLLAVLEVRHKLR
jgi:hypothetical protein